jgi:hypothetical protein
VRQFSPSPSRWGGSQAASSPASSSRSCVRRFLPSSFLYLGGIEWRLGRRFRAPHGRVTVSRSVAESGAPILFVVHRASGDWVFAESRVDAEREGATALHIQQVLELDISVGAIGGLPPGSAAVRDAPGSLEWETQPVETVTRG